MLLTGAALAGDAPSVDLDWYGYLKLDGSYDQNQTSHGNFAMWVNPNSLDEDDAQFNMTANQTRLGVNAKGSGYGEVNLGGKIEFDLYGAVSGASVAENKAILQLRHAYFTIGKGNTQLLVGQSWDLISPLNPSTLNYPVLWGCGNMGYRRPQITAFQSFGSSKSKVTVAAGLFRTIGTDLTPTFSLATGETSDGSDDGTDAAIPSLQGRVDINHTFSSGAAVRVGASGLWGQLRSETNLGNHETYDSWVGSGHLNVSFPAGFGFAGEYYSGSNTGSYFGGILNASTIDGVASAGFWGSAWAKVNSKVSLSAGYGLDDPDDADIASGNRSENACFFGNVKYNIVPQVTVGFEFSNWETTYKDGDAVSSFRAQTSFVLNF